MSLLARAVFEAFDGEDLDALARLLAPHLQRSPQPREDSNRWLSPQAAADYLGVSRKRIYDLTSQRAIVPDGRDGRTPLFTRETLDAYVSARGG